MNGRFNYQWELLLFLHKPRIIYTNSDAVVIVIGYETD